MGGNDSDTRQPRTQSVEVCRAHYPGSVEGGFGMESFHMGDLLFYEASDLDGAGVEWLL